MASRLITPTLEERLKSYPLYSQDGKGKDAVCVAVSSSVTLDGLYSKGSPKEVTQHCSPSYAVCTKRSMAILL